MTTSFARTIVFEVEVTEEMAADPLLGIRIAAATAAAKRAFLIYLHEAFRYASYRDDITHE
jgi:hypothetical protein